MLKKLMGVLFAFIMTMFFCSTVFALGSGGYRSEVLDAEASGKGFCFTAQADGPSAVHYNPAGLTQLEGSYLSLGYALIAPSTTCDSEIAMQKVQMQSQLFLIPHLYFVSDFSCENFRFGVSVTSPYGLGTDWANDSFASNITEESDLEVINFNPAIAYRVNDVLSIGGGLNYLTAHVSKHKILTTALSSTGGDFQLKGSDEGLGYNIGLFVNPFEKHRFGLSYRSDVDLTYTGTASFDNLNPLYSAIFGGSSYSTPIKTDSTIPKSLAVGYAYQPNEKWVLEADVEWTDWSSTEEELVTYPDETNATRLLVLNDGNPSPKDWEDAYSYGIGAEYKATDRLDLRCGFLYHQNPIPSISFETSIPDANKRGITVGAGYLLGNVNIDASYVLVLCSDRNVTNDVGLNVGGNINGDYEGHAHILALNFTYKY